MNEDRGLSVLSRDVRGCGLDMDHQAILWCNQLAVALAQALHGLGRLDLSRHQERGGGSPRKDRIAVTPERRLRVLRKYLITGREKKQDSTDFFAFDSMLPASSDLKSAYVMSVERVILKEAGGAGGARGAGGGAGGVSDWTNWFNWVSVHSADIVGRRGGTLVALMAVALLLMIADQLELVRAQNGWGGAGPGVAEASLALEHSMRPARTAASQGMLVAMSVTSVLPSSFQALVGGGCRGTTRSSKSNRRSREMMLVAAVACVGAVAFNREWIESLDDWVVASSTDMLPSVLAVPLNTLVSYLTWSVVASVNMLVGVVVSFLGYVYVQAA